MLITSKKVSLFGVELILAEILFSVLNLDVHSLLSDLLPPSYVYHKYLLQGNLEGTKAKAIINSF